MAWEAFAGQLAESRALRSDLSVEQARDIIWTLCSPPVHRPTRSCTRLDPLRPTNAGLRAALQRELLGRALIPSRTDARSAVRPICAACRRNWRQILRESSSRGGKRYGDAVVVRGADQALTRCRDSIRAPQPGTQLGLGDLRTGQIKLQTHLADPLLPTADSQESSRPQRAPQQASTSG